MLSRLVWEFIKTQSSKMSSNASPELIAQLADCANRLRVSSIEITSAANSGHPTSSVSAAEIVSALFFNEMHYDVAKPKDFNADRFILSKGHACPVLYAAWHEAGLLSMEECLSLRKITSDIEGHPTPRLNFIDVATGSLGQGLSSAAGMAYAGKYIDKASYRVYCLMGDGETAEGSIWEAAGFSSHYNLDNLVGIVDVNRLGQTGVTQLAHDTKVYADRFTAFGWHSIVIDGQKIEEVLKALAEARSVKGKPTAIIAQTLKGSGIEGVADLNGFHGKAVPKEKAEAIRSILKEQEPHKWDIKKPIYDAPEADLRIGSNKLSSPPEYKIGDKVATRNAYGTALKKLADQNPRIIGLDGDVSNSTFSEVLRKAHPEQYVECYIAEQNMVGAAVGMGCRGRTIPFVSSFGAFLTRAADQIRMAAVSFANVKFCGSHSGISLGEDGPSQMALEDLAIFRSIPNGVVLYPSDGVSTEYAVELASNTEGIVYIRTGRPALPVLYSNDTKFSIGKAKVLKESSEDRVVVIGGGVTVHEALKAHEELAASGIQIAVIDLFSVQPLDVETIISQTKRVSGRVVTVEDHYKAGGIGEAVASVVAAHNAGAVRQLYVTGLPRSGPPAELFEMFGISAKHITEAVKSLL